MTCTTIGYTSMAHIQLAEPRPGVRLELCDGEGCAPGPPTEPVAIPSPGASAPPAAPDTGVASLTGDSATGWAAEFFVGQPVLGFRLTEIGRTEPVEGFVDVDWIRVDGSEECGGPRDVEIQLPSRTPISQEEARSPARLHQSKYR